MKHTIFCGLIKILYYFFTTTSPDINYLLFTPKSTRIPCDLQPNTEALKMCHFDPSLETKVIIHGWIYSIPLPDALPFMLKGKYLKQNDYNVVVVNWTSYSQDQSKIGYAIASATSIFVGLKISSWMRFLELQAGANLETFHLLGHSLGAHVASYAGKSICTVGRITYLDAAGPVFRLLPGFFRANENDAIFVDAIHTSGSASYNTGKGIIFSIADVDYFPDGGTLQTKCIIGSKFRIVTGEVLTVDSPDHEVCCNHNAALIYIMASFKRGCRFLGVVCDYYEDFLSGKCNSDNAAKCEMGVYSTDMYDLPKYSQCYLNTSGKFPYCLD